MSSTHTLTKTVEGVTGVATFVPADGKVTVQMSIDGVQYESKEHTTETARELWRNLTAAGFTKVEPVEATPVVVADVVLPGVYVRDGKVYRVKISKTSGRPYANLFVEGTYTYAPGAMRGITSNMRMTKAQAKEHSGVWGTCAWCGRTLRAAESIERGIGPVCWGKFA